jgi:hypothetical protein
LRSLSNTAKEYLYRPRPYGRGVEGARFELNAILPDTRRIEYTERKLEENGVHGKVIPSEDKLEGLAEEKYRDLSAEWVAEAIAEIIASEGLSEKIADRFVGKFELDKARGHIEERFEKDRSLSWRDALSARLEEVRDEHADALKDAVREAIEDALTRPNGPEGPR